LRIVKKKRGYDYSGFAVYKICFGRLYFRCYTVPFKPAWVKHVGTASLPIKFRHYYRFFAIYRRVRVGNGCRKSGERGGFTGGNKNHKAQQHIYGYCFHWFPLPNKSSKTMFIP
jgi:hypothetical protein